MSKSKTVNFRVSRRILWVGAEAYPLQNIARARTVRLAPKRGPAVGRFIAAIVLWIALEIGDAAALRAARVPGPIRTTLIGYIEIGAAVLIALSVIGLLVALARRTLYVLVIETAGTPFAAVVNPDGNLVNWLVHRIMDAIDNTQAEFQQSVQNYYGGNHVKQFGANSIGMVNQ
jgi:hypothetical protein